jgi:hypothetical protein
VSLPSFKSTSEDAVVEDEVDVKILAIEVDAPLARDEREAFAQLKQEVLQLFKDRGFEVALAQDVALGQVEKIEHVGTAQDIRGTLDDLSARRNVHDARLVAALEQACKQMRVDLAFQIGDGPSALFRFDLVEQTLRRVLDVHEGAVVRPAEFRREAARLDLAGSGSGQGGQNATCRVANLVPDGAKLARSLSVSKRSVKRMQISPRSSGVSRKRVCDLTARAADLCAPAAQPGRSEWG